ncbi:unnamed protein product [Clonostachys byssicola]|uniref:Uncharacterized protein n=1 Tax=Clonostachys byssicola TaxID=160290 RepID=A0A9N9U3J8_9HYPO|nr:unnamed protein product [Clonostachys byssicola]
MAPASSSRVKEPKLPTIGSLYDKLNYGNRICERRPERNGVLKNSIRTFDTSHSHKYQKPLSTNDLNKRVYKDSMSQMASDFLKEEGPRLWPNDHSDTGLYEGTLVWPKDRVKKCLNKLKNDRTRKRQSGHRPRGADSSTMEIVDDEPDNTPLTPRRRSPISQQLQLPGNIQTTPQSATTHPATMEEDDPFASEGEDAEATQRRDRGRPTQPLPSATPSTTLIAPGRPASTGHSPLGATSSRSDVDGRNTSSSLTEGNLHAHNSSVPPLNNSHSREVDVISDDDGFMPPLEEILSSPDRGQSSRKGKEKEVEKERRKEMPPPRLPAERAGPVTDPDQSSQQIWPRQGTSSMSRFPSQQRGTSVFSTVECGRAPSLRPRAPEASMEGVIDEVTRPSVETDDMQHMNESREGGATTRKSPLEPEIWFRAIVSRKPPVEESWKPNGKFSDKTLEELKKELPFNFDDGDVVGLKFTLKSHEGMRIVETIDHNNRHDLQHLKRVFGERIREAMKERIGRDRGPFTFDMEIETVKCSREMTVGREESLAPLLW